MSYRKHHIKHKIHSIRPKKSIFKMLWFWILVLIIILLADVSYLILFYSGLQIKNIEVSGNSKISSDNLKSIIALNTDKKLLGFFETKSIFLANKDNISKEITKDFPIISKVSIMKKFPQTITVVVEERKPIGVYCDKNEKCFLIDQSGVIFEKAETIPQDMVIVRQATESNNFSTGEDAVNQNITTAITKIQKDLKDKYQISLTDALVTSPLRLDTTTNEGWKIYFATDPDSDISLQLTKLNLLLNGEITTEIRKKLEYIDLRFKDRAYYK